MRMLAAPCSILLAATLSQAASADPYKWCAVYGGSEGGSSNCYFMTLDQCRATVSGTGGFCTPNGFYDGRPVGTAPSPRRRRSG